MDSIPDEHHAVLVDGSYVQDLNIYAFNHQKKVTYIPTGGVPHCLAKNWNIGAAAVPKSEPFWLFCATDIEFCPGSWNNILIEENLYPDCGIIKDKSTNWNVWLVRRWAWDLLKPMDEGYKPCAGEDDDLNMKCAATGIKVRAGVFRVGSMEGSHASRLDIHRPGINSDKRIRPVVVGHFQRKWGISPSSKHDKRYREAKTKIYVGGRRRTEPPTEPFSPPTERGTYGQLPPLWPTPLRLNLGCGRRKMDGFLNVDANEGYKPDYLCDVVSDPWPWTDVDRIESYHMIEHVGRADGETLLRKSFAALRSGGMLVIECPDFAAAVERWKGNGRTLQHLFGNQTSPWQYHLWGYTRETLPHLMKRIGFNVEVVTDGTDYHQKSEPCMRVEAVKP